MISGVKIILFKTESYETERSLEHNFVIQYFMYHQQKSADVPFSMADVARGHYAAPADQLIWSYPPTGGFGRPPGWAVLSGQPDVR